MYVVADCLLLIVCWHSNCYATTKAVNQLESVIECRDNRRLRQARQTLTELLTRLYAEILDLIDVSGYYTAILLQLNLVVTMAARLMPEQQSNIIIIILTVLPIMCCLLIINTIDYHERQRKIPNNPQSHQSVVRTHLLMPFSVVY